ncbi:hypothetical protein BBJ28_00026093 [Nothophytophthora sp. Chile5]|nr:hypothetical protein BBJ28_00026093 [Nothophytophthora sp. Chile5]
MLINKVRFVSILIHHNFQKKKKKKMESQFFRPLTVYRKPVPADVVDVNAKELSKQCLMMRLSHLYAVDEHETLSKPATVDFAKLFVVKNSVVSELTELTLTGTKEMKSFESSAVAWKTTGAADDWAPPSLPVKGTSVVLQAIEVRAFRVCFAKASEEPVEPANARC